MIWNPFKKKQEPAAAPKPSAAKADQKESIEERIEREIDALPSMLKGKLKDPEVKKRFIDIAKRMEKDGVDFKSLIFLEWNKYKKDYFERKVLVFNEKPFPEIPDGATVTFITQGNVLISYEITELPEEKSDETEEKGEKWYADNDKIQTENQGDKNESDSNGDR